MSYYKVSDLATSRAIISILHNLDKLEGNKLRLKKGDISNVWSSSKSSRRRIVAAAENLTESYMMSVLWEGSITNETVMKITKAFVTNVETTPKEIEFTFDESMIKHLELTKGTLFSFHKIEDLVGIKSSYTLNMLLVASEVQFYASNRVSYKALRHVMDAEEGFEHDRGFYRHVVQVTFEDLGNLPKCQFKLESYDCINPETQRKMSYGINISTVKK